jgi:hypothetical protein
MTNLSVVKSALQAALTYAYEMAPAHYTGEEDIPTLAENDRVVDLILAGLKAIRLIENGQDST